MRAALLCALFAASPALATAAPSRAAGAAPGRSAERAINLRLDQKLHETLRRLLDSNNPAAQRDPAPKATLLTRR